jgi:hypothetical protein
MSIKDSNTIILIRNIVQRTSKDRLFIQLLYGFRTLNILDNDSLDILVIYFQPVHINLSFNCRQGRIRPCCRYIFDIVDPFMIDINFFIEFKTKKRSNSC